MSFLDFALRGFWTFCGVAILGAMFLSALVRIFGIIAIALIGVSARSNDTKQAQIEDVKKVAGGNADV